MKYKIDKSDLFINSKLHPEGSEVDLTKDQTKGIEDFLIPINESSHPELVEGQKKLKTKSSEASAKEGKGNKK